MMKRLLLLVLALAAVAFPALSDTQARQGDDWVRLADTPCQYAAVLRFIPQDIREDFKKATARFGGKDFFACWRPMGDVMHLFYEDGDQGIVPKADLTPVLDV
jgi:hypothetical protein